jgi:hypothetical protein
MRDRRERRAGSNSTNAIHETFLLSPPCSRRLAALRLLSWSPPVRSTNEPQEGAAGEERDYWSPCMHGRGTLASGNKLIRTAISIESALCIGGYSCQISHLPGWTSVPFLWIDLDVLFLVGFFSSLLWPPPCCLGLRALLTYMWIW